jgi:hypothetical protein
MESIVPSECIEDLVKPILMRKLLHRSKSRWRIEEIVKDRHLILHPKGEHKMTLIWVTAFIQEPYMPKIVFLEEKLCKLPPGCRVVLITPSKRPTDKYDQLFESQAFMNLRWRDPEQEDITTYLKALYGEKEIRDSVNIVKDTIEQELKAVDGDPQRIFLGAFSRPTTFVLQAFLE